jgi:hypothetical protein
MPKTKLMQDAEKAVASTQIGSSRCNSNLQEKKMLRIEKNLKIKSLYFLK